MNKGFELEGFARSSGNFFQGVFSKDRRKQTGRLRRAVVTARAKEIAPATFLSRATAPAAPPNAPAVAMSIRPSFRVRSSRRKANTEASSPGHMATTFVALAVIGSRRAPSSAGKDRNEPPPAIAFMAPATSAAVAGTMKRCQMSIFTIRKIHSSSTVAAVPPRR